MLPEQMLKSWVIKTAAGFEPPRSEEWLQQVSKPMRAVVKVLRLQIDGRRIDHAPQTLTGSAWREAWAAKAQAVK